MIDTLTYPPIPSTLIGRLWIRLVVCWRIGHEWKLCGGNPNYGLATDDGSYDLNDNLVSGPYVLGLPPQYSCRYCGRVRR